METMMAINVWCDGFHCSRPDLSVALDTQVMQNTLLHTGIKPALVLNALYRRYSPGAFDSTAKVPQDKVDVLLEALRLAPSSMGLQPWKFIVVKNKVVRRELKRYSLQASPLTEASHLIVLCTLKSINAQYIDELIEKEKQLNEDGYSPLEGKRTYVLSFIDNLSKEELENWMREQLYTALGFFLSACAMLHIDASPVETIDKKKFDKILSCHQLDAEAKIAVAIGYRSEQNQPTERKIASWPQDEVIITI